MKFYTIFLFFISFTLAAAPPPARYHSELSKGKLSPVTANQHPSEPSRITISDDGNSLLIKANGIPKHLVGAFPNKGNPNSIASQSYVFKVPKSPHKQKVKTPLEIGFDFGVALNGVPFDPIAAEWYQGNRSSKWQYEALSGAVALGVDENHAHVQPTGAYHYHGLPTHFLKEIGFKKGSPSPLVGYAADGFKIYALNGEKGKEMTSSYRLKKGSRPIGGAYDGTFVADYEYVKGLGTLDECNGTIYQGEYAYFLTRTYPVIPRCFSGTPDQSFKRAPSGNQNHSHQQRGHGPPKEALKACKAKSQGAACSFKTPRGFRNGRCFQPPHGGLACKP